MKAIGAVILGILSFIGMIGGALATKYAFLTGIILSFIKIASLTQIPWFGTLFVLSAIGTPLWMFFGGLFMMFLNAIILIIMQGIADGTIYMKFNYVSDLHLDYWITSNNPKKQKESIKEYIDFLLPETTPNNTLVIAGDLGHYNNQVKDLLTQLKTIYKNIIIVFGNHDLYLVSKKQSKKYNCNSLLRIKELKEIAEELDIIFLDGNIVEVDGIKFGGVCSWYKLNNDDIPQWKNDMNDYNYISKGYKTSMYGYSYTHIPYNPIDMYNNEIIKLKAVLQETCDVLITHIPLVQPQFSKEDKQFIDERYDKYYFTNNFAKIKSSGCSVYIHGHTHYNIVSKINGIDVLCNPLGHPDDALHTKIKEYSNEN